MFISFKKVIAIGICSSIIIFVSIYFPLTVKNDNNNFRISSPTIQPTIEPTTSPSNEPTEFFY